MESLLTGWQSTCSRSLVVCLVVLAAPSLALAYEQPTTGNNNNNNNNSYSIGIQDRYARTSGPDTSGEELYQPALIGFRCESAHETNLEGISVIEANKRATITLFGELFTEQTIVAFTSEFREPNEKPSDLVPVQDANKRFALRHRTRSRSFDCTDYNRVASYRLTKDDILSPNVASLEVELPEIATGKYYFCLKQPRLRQSTINKSIALANGSSANDLVWVHQGDEWYVTLIAEPPLLSMANDCMLIVLLLFLSAVTSGLNLGLMSLDMNELAVISSCGDQHERSYARTIAPLRRRGNYLLCSLLLGNVMVNSTLTVILEQMTSGLVAVIGSTLAIVVLGEIVPQAMCARQGLAIGARTIYLTYAFMIITFPLSYPISCLLDHFLGEEKGNVYDRERLMEFIKITGHHTQLESDEVAIISGALKLKKIKVNEIMTRIEDVFMLPIECKLDRETINQIIEKGYSRIPVYEFNDRKQIVALILAKDLALLDPDDHTPIANLLNFCQHPLIFIEGDATLDVALNEFKTGKSHMAVVRQIYDDGEVDKYYEAIGVVTLEDVIEEVLQVEINDETDTLSDNRRKRRRKNAQLARLNLIDKLVVGDSSGSLPSSCIVELPNSQNNTTIESNLSTEPPPPSSKLNVNLASQLTERKQKPASESQRQASGETQQVDELPAVSVSQSLSQQSSSGQQQSSVGDREEEGRSLMSRAAQIMNIFMS